MQCLASLLDDALPVVLLEQLLERRHLAVHLDRAVECVADGFALVPEAFADLFADGDRRAGDDRGDPAEEDDQYGLASGLARGDQAHEHVDQQDGRDQGDEDTQYGYPEREVPVEVEGLGASDQDGEQPDDQRTGDHDEAEDDQSGEELQQDEHDLAEDRYGLGHNGFGLGVGVVVRGGGRRLADGLGGDFSPFISSFCRAERAAGTANHMMK